MILANIPSVFSLIPIILSTFAAVMEYTLNIKGRLMDLSTPRVMGILNATPDSFYDASRNTTADEVARRADEIVSQGADMIDVGACSTRPGADFATEAEEMERLRMALKVVTARHPGVALSVDTFRPDVARMAVEEYGADIINDISEGGTEPEAMFRMVARLGVAYVLTSCQPTLRDTLLTLAAKVQQLRDFGQKDIIIDPGFGFGKTVEQNFSLLAELDKLLVLELPVLVGVSRKSMIWRTLDCSPQQALNGTSVLNTVALMKGASILRVHDVSEAVECLRLCDKLSNK